MYVNFRLSIKKTQKKKIDFSKFTQLYYKQKNKMSNHYIYEIVLTKKELLKYDLLDEVPHKLMKVLKNDDKLELVIEYSNNESYRLKLNIAICDEYGVPMYDKENQKVFSNDTLEEKTFIMDKINIQPKNIIDLYNNYNKELIHHYIKKNIFTNKKFEEHNRIIQEIIESFIERNHKVKTKKGWVCRWGQSGGIKSIENKTKYTINQNNNQIKEGILNLINEEHYKLYQDITFKKLVFINGKKMINWNCVEDNDFRNFVHNNLIIFRPQTRMGECNGCKSICYECENLIYRNSNGLY